MKPWWLAVLPNFVLAMLNDEIVEECANYSAEVNLTKRSRR